MSKSMCHRIIELPTGTDAHTRRSRPQRFLQALIFRIEGRLCAKKARSSYACDLIEQARQNHPVSSHWHPHEFSAVVESAAQSSRHIGMDLPAHRVPTHAPHGTVAPWPRSSHQCQGDPPWVGRPVFGVVANIHRSSQTCCQGFSGAIRLFCGARRRAQQEQQEHSATGIGRVLRSSLDAFTDFPC